MKKMPGDKTLLDDAILSLLLGPFMLQPHEVEFLGFSQNYVYRSRDRNRIFRISTSRHVKREEIEAEIEWIKLLRRHRLPVCEAISSPHGRVCEQFEFNGVEYLVCCFEHAPGHAVELEDLTPEFYTALGRIAGNLHYVSRSTASTSRHLLRRDWSKSRLLCEDVDAAAAQLGSHFCDALGRLIAESNEPPRSDDTFGMIHADLSIGNFSLHDGGIWIFDFDNCEFGYFLQDIGTALYDAIYSKHLNRVPAQN